MDEGSASPEPEMELEFFGPPKLRFHAIESFDEASLQSGMVAGVIEGVTRFDIIEEFNA